MGFCKRLFSPLEGGEAISESEGNISDKIVCEGNVDTNKIGIYLIKYSVQGKNGTYTDYRWISVLSNPDCDQNGQTIGTYFNNGISINLSNLVAISSISITKDGSSYTLGDSGIISEEGNYKLSFSSAANQTNLTQPLLKTNSTISGEGTGDNQPYDLEFTIDKTSPQILQCYPQVIDEGTQISADMFVKASDNNKLTYEYYNNPLWNKVGEQNVQIVVKDLAGNKVSQDVKLTIIDKCDIDRDGKVNILDLAAVAKNYNVKSTQANWNQRLDFNKDNIIDIFDLVTCSRRF